MKDIERIPICLQADDVIITQFINTADLDIRVGTEVRVAEDTKIFNLGDSFPVYLTNNVIVRIKFRDIWKWYRNNELLYEASLGDVDWPPIRYKDLGC